MNADMMKYGYTLDGLWKTLSGALIHVVTEELNTVAGGRAIVFKVRMKPVNVPAKRCMGDWLYMGSWIIGYELHSVLPKHPYVLILHYTESVEGSKDALMCGEVTRV